jgi:AcrR family transcriptional regulator
MTVGDGFLRRGAAGLARTRSAARATDPARDRAIAQAVLQILAEAGFRRLTMDEVALTAGVSKATIYRRWSSKIELLASFLEVASEDALGSRDTGSLRGDLLVFLQSTAEVLQGPTGRATRAVIGELPEEPRLADAYRAGPLAEWDRTLQVILDRAVRRGEIRAAAARSLAVQAGPAIMFQAWFLREQALEATLIVALVDDIMLPLLTRR